jgi:hypothetical protein
MCPFLVRTMVKVGGHHDARGFDRAKPSSDEINIYSW